MSWLGRDSKHLADGFLSRLRRDARGNTLALMAAMLIPLAGFAGSAIDMARLYTVKTRLQQACDAGVLAGRKFMDTNSDSSTLDSNATTQASIFFKNNIKEGWFKTSNVNFQPAKTSENQVSGTASAIVPMTIMAMFGQPSKTINVSCEARYDVADTDVIFVLDTTGSMACTPQDSDSDCTTYVNQQVNNASIIRYSKPADSPIGASSGSMNTSVAGYPNSTGFYVPEKNGSRIAALRTAVVDFYKTVASSADPSTHIRYGFVTYTSTVNAGKAIMDASPGYMIGGAGSGTTDWNYQSRTPLDDYDVVNPDQSTSYTNVSSATCDTYKVPRNPAVSVPRKYNSNGQATETKVVYSGTKCTLDKHTYGPKWTYQPVSYNVSSFLTSASVDDPSKVDNSTASWQGCIEERQTTAGASTFDVDNLPPDLNPDTIPSSAATRWAPMWPDVIYGRNWDNSTYIFSSTGARATNGDGFYGPPADLTIRNYTTYNPSSYYYNSNTVYSPNMPNRLLQQGYVSCGKPVRRLAVLSLQDVTNYVNASDFRAIGGTYHDTGMIWGTRMLSRSGIFAADNSAWSGHQAPNRVIIFLTDGDMSPNPGVYGMYGVEYFDQRVTGGTYASQKDYHNARFLAECGKAKKMGISVWTVSIAPAVTNEMQQCATSSAQALWTTTGTGLSDTFVKIAKQVAMLRLSR